ncbi:MAG: hypothetical protein AAGJ80_06745 [Cyanobacteria bacterium J06553_1]
MSAVLCIILFLLGLGLALGGGAIGIVQAFQESPTWGLLYLFVPFASLVFLIKFWQQREWVRKSFFMGLAGSGAIVASTIIGVLTAPPMEFSDYGSADFDFEEGYGEGSYTGENSGAADSFGGDNEFVATTAGGTATATYAINDPFRDAINLATDAANRTQTATTTEDWDAIAYTWKDSIALLGAVPQSDPNYTTAQSKIDTYSKNLTYAQQNEK